MDLDDVIKVLIPKSMRKALKQNRKERGLLGMVLWLWRLWVEDGKNGRNLSAPSPVPTPQAVSANTQDPLWHDLAQARTYATQIEALAQATAAGSLEQIRLESLSARVAEWLQMIEAIVTRTLAQGEDALLTAERKQVPAAIKRLEKQLEATEDEALRQKLVHTLANRRKQLAQLEQVANGRQMAELKVENTLAQLGIIYSQLHSGQYMLERSGYERLAAEIAEEVHGLDDYMGALNDLQSGTR